MFVRTKELPKFGFLGHARNFLYAEKLWEIKVLFCSELNRLGQSNDDRCRVDVIAFGNDGKQGGWKGCYGGSTAELYEESVASQATAGRISVNLPPNVAILEITRHWEKSWCRMYLNPEHQSKLLTAEPPTDLDMERVKAILGVFAGLKPAHRHEELNKLSVSTEELEMLVKRGWLKCNKGKKAFRHEKPEYVGKYPMTFKYYEFGGARITTEGKNIR